MASVWGEGLKTVGRKTTTAVLEFVHAELAGMLTTATSHLHTKEFADGRAHKAASCLSLYTVHKLQFCIQPHIQVLPINYIKNNALSQSYLMG